MLQKLQERPQPHSHLIRALKATPRPVETLHRILHFLHTPLTILYYEQDIRRELKPLVPLVKTCSYFRSLIIEIEKIGLKQSGGQADSLDAVYRQHVRVIDLRRYEEPARSIRTSTAWADRILSRYPHVKTLHLPSKCLFDRAIASILKRLKNLETIDVSLCQNYRPDRFDNLALLPKLKRINNRIYSETEYLEFHGSDDILRLLNHLKNRWPLVQPALTVNEQLQSSHITAIATLRHLHTLELGEARFVNDGDLARLRASLPELTEFGISSPTITDLGIHSLGGLALRRLNICNCIRLTDRSFQLIAAQFPTLRIFSFGNNAMTNTAFTYLPRLQSLENLLVAFFPAQPCPITTEGVARIADCRSLKKLVIKNGELVTDALLIQFAALPALGLLSLLNPQQTTPSSYQRFLELKPNCKNHIGIHVEILDSHLIGTTRLRTSFTVRGSLTFQQAATQPIQTYIHERTDQLLKEKQKQ